MNAYVQQPICGPSRQSFLSGRMPETTGIYHFEKWLPNWNPATTSIPRYFKENLGYAVVSFGKIWHGTNNVKNAPGMMAFYQGWYTHPLYTEDNDAPGNSECNNGYQWHCQVSYTFLYSYQPIEIRPHLCNRL